VIASTRRARPGSWRRPDQGNLLDHRGRHGRRRLLRAALQPEIAHPGGDLLVAHTHKCVVVEVAPARAHPSDEAGEETAKTAGGCLDVVIDDERNGGDDLEVRLRGPRARPGRPLRQGSA